MVISKEQEKISLLGELCVPLALLASVDQHKVGPQKC